MAGICNAPTTPPTPRATAGACVDERPAAQPVVVARAALLSCGDMRR
jgi:hypothetical protein